MERNEKEKRKIEMEYNRYQFLFGFENMMAIFRSADLFKYAGDSEHSHLIYACEHNCSTIEDALLDLNALIQTEEYGLKVNDVTGIKINGCISCYRYLGGDNFREAVGYIEKEKAAIVENLHCENKVINVLKGEVIPIGEIELDKNTLYAIDGEKFKARNYEGKIFPTTDYSLYRLESLEIRNINPYPRPFLNINIALYYFLNNREHKRNGNMSPLLLLNRNELNMVKDYYQLNTLMV